MGTIRTIARAMRYGVVVALLGVALGVAARVADAQDQERPRVALRCDAYEEDDVANVTLARYSRTARGTLRIVYACVAH